MRGARFVQTINSKTYLMFAGFSRDMRSQPSACLIRHYIQPSPAQASSNQQTMFFSCCKSSGCPPNAVKSRRRLVCTNRHKRRVALDLAIPRQCRLNRHTKRAGEAGFRARAEGVEHEDLKRAFAYRCIPVIYCVFIQYAPGKTCRLRARTGSRKRLIKPVSAWALCVNCLRLHSKTR